MNQFRELLLGPAYLGTKRLIRETEYLPQERLKTLQESYLKETLNYALKEIPYYQEMVKNNTAKKNEPFALLKEFPIIDKNEVRRNTKKFLDGRRWRYHKATTGGSTGEPLLFYLDKFRTRQIEKAFMFDLWSRVGYKFGDPIFNLRGRTPPKGQFVSHDRFFNIYYASSLNLSKKNIHEYVNFINQTKPLFLHGYPSTMYQLAMLMESSKLKLNYSPKAILCGSEKLFDFQRAKLESLFQSKVFSWYGHSEYLLLGGECEYTNLYHFYPQYGYMELMPTGKRDEKGREIFEMVGTGFNNRVMPLIRYKTGDYVIPFNSGTCMCGRNYVLIEDVIGRESEFLVDKNGEILSANSFLYHIEHQKIFPHIESIQVYQERPGEIEIVIVKKENPDERMFGELKKELNSLLSGRININFVLSDIVDKTPLGKMIYVKQELDMRNYLQ